MENEYLYVMADCVGGIFWYILSDLCKIHTKHIKSVCIPNNNISCRSAVSAGLFFLTSGGQSILTECKGINWTTFVLGLAIVGLEAGSIYMYKAGWNINTGYIVKSIILGIALIAVGYFLYKESFSVTKAVGIMVCLFGLYLINK